MTGNCIHFTEERDFELQMSLPDQLEFNFLDWFFYLLAGLLGNDQVCLDSVCQRPAHLSLGFPAHSNIRLSKPGFTNHHSTAV